MSRFLEYPAIDDSVVGFPLPRIAPFHCVLERHEKIRVPERRL